MNAFIFLRYLFGMGGFSLFRGTLEGRQNAFV